MNEEQNIKLNDLSTNAFLLKYAVQGAVQEVVSAYELYLSLLNEKDLEEEKENALAEIIVLKIKYKVA